VFEAVLALARMVMFGLSLGLTIISFQAYRRQGSTRLEYAFVGFAFISMGAAMTTLNSQLGATPIAFDIAETVPFIVGFSMLYLSLYR